MVLWAKERELRLGFLLIIASMRVDGRLAFYVIVCVIKIGYIHSLPFISLLGRCLAGRDFDFGFEIRFFCQA